MNLAAPETLLAALVAAPAGLVTTAAHGEALRLLAARGHRLLTAGAGRQRLECATQHFDPARFAALQRGDLGQSLEVWERLGSTNERAWERVAAGAAAGSLVLAEEQGTGRGRQGRSWDCPSHAGLLFSLLLHAPLRDSPRPQLLPLALALGVAEGLRQASGAEVRLSWPNDLVLPRGDPAAAVALAKVGGILLETRAEFTSTVVVGCGLNVRVGADFFAAHGLLAAASLQSDLVSTRALEQRGAAAEGQGSPRGATAAREELLAAVLAGMERRCGDWKAGSWAPLLQAWESLDALQGREVEVQRGAESCHGRARGITPAGLLEVELPDGDRRAFAAGEVHLQ